MNISLRCSLNWINHVVAISKTAVTLGHWAE